MIGKLVRWLYRSAVTGRFISWDEAKAQPETTVRERGSPKRRKSMKDEGDLNA